MGKKKSQQSPRKFETESGIEFIVGRDRYQNDEMVKQYKRINPNYWWFHADKISSCHAILFSNEITKQDIREVSYKIWKYSKLKKQNIGYVAFTQLKNIKSTDIPGMVLHEKNVIKRIQVNKREGRVLEPDVCF
jgi:predicted ribosome quality control (RQC) complex YloA/Tae2 family protein